ncbi:MAG: ORF2 [Henan mamastrovirus 3]|nr:MAG: ORF2 [Henan mamastrovirus 3]
MAKGKNVQSTTVTTTTAVRNRRSRRRRRRFPRTNQSARTTVTTTETVRPANNRSIGRRRRNRFRNGGPKMPGNFRQKITATLGTIGANQSDKIELEMSTLLNPALMKEVTGSNAYGPLQMYAANYSMWRFRQINIKLTPLVGSSAVSGTAIRTSINMSGQPSSASWSALGARRHKDTNPGRPMVMRINGSSLPGPNDGWFFCNTKNDPKLCIAGSLEIHSLGRTLSTYTNDPFKGPLFLVELTAEWEFKNYSPEPGMLNLLKTTIQEQPQQVKINAKPGEPITISIPKESQMARAISQIDIAADATPSEIIWQIFDSTLTLVSGNLPPPFNWLFEAGWWFVKRIANKKQSGDHVDGEADAGELTFQVYQSISDAQNDVPCIATGTASTTNVNINDWEMMQITPGNLGTQQTSVAGLQRMAPLTLDPIEITSLPELGRPTLPGHVYNQDPPYCIAVQEAGEQKRKVYTFSIWRLNKPTFMQNGQSIDPAQLQSHPYPILAKEAGNFTQIGRVFAAGYARIRDAKPVLHWTTVLWRADVTRRVRMVGPGTRSNQFFFVQPNISKQETSFPRTTYTITPTDTQSFGGGHEQAEDIVEGDWYLSAFVACQIDTNKSPEFTNYGVPFYLGRGLYTSNISCDPRSDAFEVGAIMQTTMPIVLKPPAPTTTTLTTAEVYQLRQLLAPRPHYPPLDFDNLEMPPLEGDEEEEQGAVGGYAPLEGARQQPVRPPEAIGVFKSEDTTPLLEETEEEDDEDYESDLDDDDYAELPSLLKNLFTPEAKSLCEDLKRKGLDHDVAAKAARVAFPHPAEKLWQASYHNALVDGLSPPSARDCAWSAISEYL